MNNTHDTLIDQKNETSRFLRIGNIPGTLTSYGRLGCRRICSKTTGRSWHTGALATAHTVFCKEQVTQSGCCKSSETCQPGNLSTFSSLHTLLWLSLMAASNTPWPKMNGCFSYIRIASMSSPFFKCPTNLFVRSLQCLRTKT